MKKKVITIITFVALVPLLAVYLFSKNKTICNVAFVSMICIIVASLICRLTKGSDD